VWECIKRIPANGETLFDERKNMKKQYYIYEWYIVETGEVFYIGKGNKTRYKDTRNRNRIFNKIRNDNICESRILENNLEEDSAYLKEKEKIAEYREKGWCKANFDDGGHPLAILAGSKNPQYGVSPRDRMSPEVYEGWLEKHRISNAGEKNPNFGNRKLSGFYKENPDIAKEKQSRKGDKNGRAKTVILYDLDMNFVYEFSCARYCADFLIKNGYTKSKNPVVNIYTAIAENKKYLSFYFKYKE
jgi:hypothetical protein